MKPTLFLTFILICLLPLNGYSQTTSDNDDVQFWNDTSVSFPLIKTEDNDKKSSVKLSGQIIGTLRIGQNIQRFVDERIGFGLDYKVNKYFTISPGYIYIATQPSRNRKEFEHRLRFDFSAEKKWKKFTLKNRNRVEHRIRHSRSDSTRYRNRLQFVIPVKNNDGKELFAPFVGDEVFYDFTAKAWTRNEFTVGISKKFNTQTSAEFFYSLRSNSRASTLRTVNIFGINLKFTID
jgi:hypothetical protein